VVFWAVTPYDVETHCFGGQKQQIPPKRQYPTISLTTRRHNPEGRDLNLQGGENFKSSVYSYMNLIKLNCV